MKKDDMLKIIDEVMNNREIDSIRNAILAIRDKVIDAFYRHWLKFIENPMSVDEESGIPHYKHCACNLAFICEMLKDGADDA